MHPVSKKVTKAKLLLLLLAFTLSFSCAAQAQEESPDPEVKPAQVGTTPAPTSTTMVERLKDSNREHIKVEHDESNQGHVISVRDMLFQRQVEHEKNLIDKFLLGVAILFSIISMMLFISLPPEAKTN